MFSEEPAERIYKQSARRQTEEAYGDNLGNWAATGRRGITVPKKARLRELRQLIGREILTNDSSLSGPGLPQVAGHPESPGKSTAKPTSPLFLQWDVWTGGHFLRALSKHLLTHSPTSGDSSCTP